MITDLYPPLAVGGYEISCKETADEISRRGHEVVILTSSWGCEHTCVNGNIHRILYFLKKYKPVQNNLLDKMGLLKRCVHVKWAFESRKNTKITRVFLADQKPDLVIIWNMANLGTGPIIAVQEQGIPCIYNIDDYWLLDLKTGIVDDPSVLRKKYRTLLHGLRDFEQLNVKHLLMTSKSLKKIHIKHGFSEEIISVIPRGLQSNSILSPELLGDLPRNRFGFPRLIFVGRLVPEKAPDIAIKTVDVLKHTYELSNIKLDIVGKGSQSYVSGLQTLVKDLDLEENINFLGWVDYSQVVSMYKDYDALLFPSRWEEPFGRTVLEAMSQGLPVISSKAGGPLDLIQHGENGFLVPVDDPHAFAEAFLYLVRSDQNTQKMRETTIKIMNERFTNEHIIDRVLDYIENVMASETSRLDVLIKTSIFIFLPHRIVRSIVDLLTAYLLVD